MREVLQVSCAFARASTREGDRPSKGGSKFYFMRYPLYTHSHRHRLLALFMRRGFVFARAEIELSSDNGVLVYTGLRNSCRSLYDI